MATAGAARAEAYALDLALLGEWSANGAFPVDSVTVLDARGGPAAGATVTLGGVLILTTDARGVARFARTEAGPLEVVAEHPTTRARAVLLDSDQGKILTGSAGR